MMAMRMKSKTRCTTTHNPDEPDGDDEFFTEDGQNYEDADATYLAARRQMAHLKTSRGYPVVALKDTSSMPSSTPSSQGPRAPKVEAGANPRKDVERVHRLGRPKVDK